MENSSSQSPSSSSVSRISPLVLLVIIILAVIFFIYGVVHLVLWFLMKRPSSPPIFQSNRFPEATRSRALQRQLQQLFRLHDSGLDQVLIDSLPVFFYKDIMGLKEPFDCAVCLSEFLDEDKLRLLPACSHAFHIHCIDTWLLSNSTCPLCRAILSSSDFSIQNQIFNSENSWGLSNRITGDEENACSDNRRPETVEEDIGEKRVVSVRLGKFKNNGTIENTEERSRCNLDGRRCYSMGSYQYVVGDSNLQVILSENRRSEGEESEVRRAYLRNIGEDGDEIGKRIRGESFSVSKIWLWSNKSHFHASSNAAFP